MINPHDDTMGWVCGACQAREDIGDHPTRWGLIVFGAGILLTLLMQLALY